MALTTVTVLFTDVVGSTELMVRVGEAAADELRRAHFERLRRVIASTEGREVKNLGDGLMVVFDSAAAALSCAAGMQQALTSAPMDPGRPERIKVRIGVSAGEVETEGGDYFGVPVVEAARLCAAAGASEILVSEMVRLLVRSRGGFDLQPAGGLELKGLAEPVEAAWLRWEPVAAVDTPTVPLALSSLQSAVFVGRVAEREVLTDALKRARTGERRGVLISGEPGLGKSTLVAAFANEASSEGVTVVYGRCDEDLRISYQPWIEALSDLVQRTPPDVVAAHVAARGRVLGRLVSEVAKMDAVGSGAQAADDENERHLMFVAVVDLLQRVSVDAPVVVVLDDLHWADPGTVQLLRWVLSAAIESQVVIVGTFRDSDIDADHSLAELLAELHRRSGIDRLKLAGLGDAEVLAFLEALAGHEMTEDGLRLRDALLAETGGNPFFLGEMLRHLNESGAIRQGDDGRWTAATDLTAAGLPVSIREVIGRRVRWLGPETHQALSVAAVIGRDFDLDLLGRVSDLDEDALVDLCDSAVDAAVLRPSERVDGYSFAHALIERTLYDELSPTRRARIHRSVAEAIEALCGDDPGRRVGELAHHWRQATRLSDTAKAVTYARLAGDRALESLAATDAVRWYRDALELMTDAERHSRNGCELLIALAVAELHAGVRTYRDTVHAAGRLATSLDATDLVVRAALAHRTYHDHYGTIIQESVDLIEAALDRIGDHDSPGRARLLALLVSETMYPLRRAELRMDAAHAAVTMAQRLGDPTVLADVLVSIDTFAPVHEGWHPWFALEQATCERLREIGDARREMALRVESLQSAVTLADRETFDASERRCSEIASRLGTPEALAHASVVPLLLANLDGEPDRVEAAALARYERHVAAGDHTGPGAVTAMSFVISAFMRGTLDDLLDALAANARKRADQPNNAAAHVWALAVTEHIDEARPLLPHEDDERLTSGFLATASWAFLAEAAARCNEPVAALAHLDLLRPCRDQIAGIRGVFFYAVAHATGLAHACLGDLDAAIADIEHAIAIHERMRAPFHTAYSQTALADVLSRRGAPADRDRASTLASAALDVARSRSYGYIIRDATAVLNRLT